MALKASAWTRPCRGYENHLGYKFVSFSYFKNISDATLQHKSYSSLTLLSLNIFTESNTKQTQQAMSDFR